MSDQTVTLRITSDARGLVAGVEVVKRELGGLGGAGETAGRRTTAAMQSVSPAIEGIRRSVMQLVGAYASMQSVRALVTMADQYANISARLKLATSDAASYAVAQSEVFRIAQLTSTSLNSTATLYARMSAALKDAGASQAELATITQTVNQALLVSGATTAESSSAIIQLSQAMASGVLRGEEFNSVNEAAPRLMQALAESMGRTRGELRKLAENGELTADVLRRALVDEAGKIAAEAAQMPITIERAWQQLENAVTRYVGQADQAAGASSAIAQAIVGLANNLDQVEDAIVAATLALGVFAGARGVGAAIASIAALRQAMAAAALWTAWTGGATAAAGAMGLFANAGKALFAMMGGWATVAAAAAVGVYYLATRQSEAEQTSERLSDAIDKVRESTGRYRDEAIRAAQAEIIVTEQRIAALEGEIAMRQRLASMSGGDRVTMTIASRTGDDIADAREQIEQLVPVLAQARAEFEAAKRGMTLEQVRDDLVSDVTDIVASIDRFGPASSILRAFGIEIDVAGAKTRAAFANQESVKAFIAGLEEQIGTLRERIAELQGGAEAVARLKLADLKVTNPEQSRQIEALIAQLSGLEAQYKGMQAAPRELAKTTKDLAREQEALAAANAGLAGTMVDLAVANGDMTEALGEYAQGVMDAYAEAEKLREAKVAAADVEAFLTSALAANKRAYDENTRAAAANAAERARAAGAVDALLANLDQEIAMTGLSEQERRRLVVVMQAEEAMRRAINEQMAVSGPLSEQEIADRIAEANARANALVDAQEYAAAARDSAAEYQRVWTSSIDRVATAFGDWIAGGIKSFRDFRKAITDIARQALADIIAMFLRNKIMVSFGMGGLGASGGAMAGVPGIGGAGGGLNLGNLFSGQGGITSTISNIFGSVFGAEGILAQGVGALASGVGQLALSTGSSMLASLAGGLGQLAAVAGPIGAVIAAAAAINSITGGKLFGTSYRPESSSTTLSLGADGGDASASVREVRQRSLFRGRQWRNRSVDAGDEAVQAADQLFDAVRQVMVSAAQAMESEAPAMIEAALRTVQEYDSKGKLKATKYFVDVLGRTWEEASAEAAATRISAEALIATIDAALGTTVQAASEAAGGAIGGVIDGMADKVDDAAGSITPPFDTLVKSIGAAAGEASAIAERWRDDAAVLMDGAQMMLAAAADIRRGVGLLGDGSLTAVVDLIEDMAAEGESLAAAYARVSAATGLLQQALDLSGVTLDKTREEFVRFASDIAAAAGGIERAGQLWSSYFQTFYTETERLALAVSRAESGAVREFSDIGLNADDFMGDGGGQRFRDMFEQVLPTLSAEAVVQWLEAANALGIWIDASAALARASGDAAEAVTGVTQTLDELMADVTAQLADYAPPQTFAERLAAITANTDLLIERAVALGATEEQLAQIRALGAAQMQEVLDEQAAAMGRYRDLVQGLSDELTDARGLSEFQREMRQINRDFAETTRSMNEAARAAGLQGAAEADLAMAHELAAIRAAAAIARLEERGRGVVERLYGTPLERLNEQIALLEQGMQGFASAATGGMEQVTQATDNAAQAQIGAQQRIREWLDNLMLGPLGGLRPRDALAEAQGQFAELLARARGGDAEAMAALPQLADQLLRLGQQVYASGQPYFDLRDQIRAALTEIAAMPVAEPGGGIVPGGGGGGGGGSVGGGGAVGGDLQALYEERERLLAQQAAAERRELAMELAGIIRDLTVATGQPLSEIEATLGFAMGDLIADLGVNLSDMTVATASQLADIAQTMGVELTDLAASVGVELGALADRQSLLNDALEAEITGLPQRERDLLEPLLRNVEDAAALGDTAGVEAGIGEMERAIQDMAPELRDALAPYFLAIRPADPTTELQHIASIDGGIASAVAELGLQTMSLGDIAYTLTNIEAALVGGSSASVPSYDVGTAFVPRDGLAMIHRGETILPAPVAAFFRRAGIPMPVPVPAAKAAAARDDRVIAGAIRDGNAAVVTELRALTGRVERLESTTRDASERQTRALDRQTDALRTL